MKFLNDYKHILIWIPFTVFIFTISAYFLSNFYGPYYQYWQSQYQENQQERSIASSIGNLELDAYKDYFYNNSFNKYLNYKISADVWMSHTEPKAMQVVKDSFQNSLKDTLEESTDIKNHFELLLQQRLMATLIENFINQLNRNKILDGKFQIDINFKPHFEQNLNYEKEHSAGKLVNLNQYTLKEEIENNKATLIQSVVDTPMPSTHKKYQYGGGIISIFINLQKGHGHENFAQLKFRRYFRANKLTRPDIKISSEELKLKMLHLVPTNVSKHNFMTIDLCKRFSLETGKSIKEKVVFHFGKVVPSVIQDGQWLIKKTTPNQRRSIVTGDFFLHGKYFKEKTKLKSKLKLEKLVYSFHNNSFTKDSEISVQLYNRGPAQIDTDQESTYIKDIFIKSSAPQLIKVLELEEFLYDNNQIRGEIL